MLVIMEEKESEQLFSKQLFLLSYDVSLDKWLFIIKQSVQRQGTPTKQTC